MVSDGLTLPALIRTESNDGVLAVLMNRKAYSKSIERKEIWIVHPETNRVLPIEGSSYLSISDTAGAHYELVVSPEIFTLVRNSTTTEGPFNKKEEPKTVVQTAASDATLARLRAVISERRRTLPEGSYTTHLFQKGEEKIRKKTGEEAIELLLAQNPEEIVSESADLIYHLMVLLEVKGLSIESVLSELERRMK